MKLTGGFLNVADMLAIVSVLSFIYGIIRVLISIKKAPDNHQKGCEKKFFKMGEKLRILEGKREKITVNIAQIFERLKSVDSRLEKIENKLYQD